MLLRANLNEISLADVVRLVTISAQTGVLTLASPGRRGDLYFRDGTLYYAAVDPPVVPLGERLVRAGVVTSEQLAAALDEQRSTANAPRIGALLVARGLLDRGVLAETVADQIEETAFGLLAWTEGEFQFVGGVTREEDIIVELSVDDLTVGGPHRVAGWEPIIGALGSLQHIPRLTPSEGSSGAWGVSLSQDEWRVASFIDGRRDIAAIVDECGLERIAAAGALHRLHNAGLVEIQATGIQGWGKARTVLVRGSIDFYVDIFLSSLGGETLMHHPLLEIAGDDGAEVLTRAVMLPATEEGHEVLVVGADAATRQEVWLQVAMRCAACVLLVNANSVESARASQADLGAVRTLPELPVVVLSYVSVGDEGLDPVAIRKVLGLGQEIVVTSCDLRDHRVAMAAVRLALEPRSG